MKKIVEVLMNYGMGFEYENRGSNGEKVICLELGIEVSNQNGNIYYSISAPTEIIKETENNYKIVSDLIEQECIDETSSF